ncbi:outer membrane lipid asymmetry maintenance protein MlaD [Candidatus Sumerlaeota bacterium]|nr:outer membrane lipid asymmetry maintenance protein MlaD [Candidatus Sumerlaeota bacterium]
MNKRSLETSVGVFVLIGLICIGYLTIKLGKMEMLGSDYYLLQARFAHVSGLKKGAVVDIAGVQVGTVESIRLDTRDLTALVTMKIENDIPVDIDAIASIKTAGLIGDRYLRIDPGGSDEMLKNGDMIIETQPAMDLEDLVSKYIFGSAE